MLDRLQERRDRRSRGRPDTAFDVGIEVVVEIGEDDRRFVEQQFLDLAGDGALAGEIERLHVLGHQPVIGRVVEVRGVPGAVAGQRRVQEDVRHAAIAVVGDAERHVEPVGLAGHGLAVIGVLAFDVQR